MFYYYQYRQYGCVKSQHVSFGKVARAGRAGAGRPCPSPFIESSLERRSVGVRSYIQSLKNSQPPQQVHSSSLFNFTVKFRKSSILFCSLNLHPLQNGMSIVIRVGDKEDQPPAPYNFPTCNDWRLRESSAAGPAFASVMKSWILWPLVVSHIIFTFFSNLT